MSPAASSPPTAVAEKPTCWAIIVAAGAGRRGGGSVPKQFASLAGLPVLAYSLRLFARHPAVVGTVAVINPSRDQMALADAVRAAGIDAPRTATGGETRQASVRAGLDALSDVAPARVIVHDAARPNARADLVDALLLALDDHDGAIAATPVADTLKAATATTPARIAETRERRGLWQAQTPQAFRYATLRRAHREARANEAGVAPDDAALIERIGGQVALIDSPSDNFKITTATDLAIMDALFAGRSTTVVGSGYDIHATQGGASVVLCGVRLTAPVSLLGHSDADVGLHAVTDAILGALAEGDIGAHFPPSDPAQLDADSATFLNFACSRLAAHQAVLRHLDVTLIAEQPKLGPQRDLLRHRLAELLRLVPNRVSVKATTHEGIGALGRGEAIAAYATATVALPESTSASA